MTRAQSLAARSAKRQSETAEYAKRARAYLEAHPYCQAAIFMQKADEAAVIAAKGRLKGYVFPRAVQIHHRNKRNGRRLLDERWWLGVSAHNHEAIEQAKGWARVLGFLLPINADIEGRWGDGNQALPTPEFLKRRAME